MSEVRIPWSTFSFLKLFLFYVRVLYMYQCTVCMQCLRLGRGCHISLELLLWTIVSLHVDSAPADQTREEPRGRAPSRCSGPAQPAHLLLPGPPRSPRPPAPEPAGKTRPVVPRHGGGRGSEKLGGRRDLNPGAPGRAAASLPCPPGRLGPSAACASSGWRLAWAGPGPPPQAGRIRQGPRPEARGGRVRAAGRAGRPAGSVLRLCRG